MIVKFKTMESVKGGNNLGELPRNWVLTKFMDVFDIQGGTQPPKNTFKYEPRLGYVQLLQIRDFGERSLPTYIPDTDNLKKCSEEDVLIARYGASIGRILTGLSGAYNVAMAKVDIPEGIHNRFAYHLLRTELFQAPLRLVSRSAQSGFNKLDLIGIELPIAPFNEQKRIADKLDLLLAQIDACRDRLEQIPRILDRFRQSVIATAISGKTIKDWRKTEWKTVTLKDVCLSISDGDHQAPPQVEQGIPFITIAAINDKRLELDRAKRFVPHSYFEKLKDFQKPQLNDILFSVTGSIAIPALVSTTEPFTFQRHIAILKPNSSLIISKFLFYSLCTESTMNQALAVATGTAQKTIPLLKLRTFMITLPSIVEQQEIINYVDSMFVYADQIEDFYQQASKRINYLTPSLLHKAFCGELIPQDPNDEPASVLLERIRAERRTNSTTQKNQITIRRPKMSKMSSAAVKNEILNLLNDKFSFDELHNHLHQQFLVDYEALKEILFDLLDEQPESSIAQIFDSELEKIRFIRR